MSRRQESSGAGNEHVGMKLDHGGTSQASPGSPAMGFPIVGPPDFDLSITVDSPADSQVLHPSNLPVQIRGSVTAAFCTVDRVEVKLGASAPFSPAIPRQPRDWSAWSFSGTPSPAQGPVRVVARVFGSVRWMSRPVHIHSDDSILLLSGAGIAVPAFWSLNGQFPQYWQSLQQAGAVSLPSVTVIEGSWPATARNDPAWKARAQAQLDALPPGSVRLGYVGTRDTNLNLLGTITGDVAAWYAQFAGHIQGIYFDELILPQLPGSVADAQSVVGSFRAQHPGQKVMVLAGQCEDPYVVGPDIDWALLWEDTLAAYRDNFVAANSTVSRPIPSWWKDPVNRSKIVHVVHDCSEADRQLALGLSNERNAGHVFVMDQRGIANGRPVLYDHLPPYWDAEVREVNSFYDFGFDAPRAFLAAHRYGVSQGKLHAWPNCEAAWYPSGHVRGTFLLDAGPHAVQRDVLQSALGSPQPFDIPRLWQAAHTYARAQGFETALPTFEQIQTPNGPAFRLILLTSNPWLSAQQVPRAATYQHPTFAEPLSVARNIGRWAAAKGFVASFPTFVPDDPNNPRGVSAFYNCYVLSSSAPVSWRDVPTSVYLDQL